MELSHVIILFGVFQGLAISLYQLLLAPKRTSCGSYFSLSLIGLSASLAGFVFRELYSPWNVPFIFFGSLFGPALYFYVLTFISEKVKPRLIWLHFLPFIILTAYTLTVFFTEQNPDRYIQWVLGVLPPLSMLVLAQLLVYYVLSFLKIRSTWKSFGLKKLNWLRAWFRYLMSTYTLMLITMIVLTVLGQTNASLETRYQGQILFLISVSLIVYSFGLLRLVIPEIVRASSGKGRSLPSEQSDSEDTVNEIDRLKLIMEQEKPYLEPDFSLETLASMAALNPKRLSFLLNNAAHTSFNDFVNTYRIADVKGRLSDPAFDHLSIMALGMDSGFNSKSTFNSVFKKHTGETPLQFRKRFQHK